MSVLFISGLIGGSAMLFIQFLNGAQAISAIRILSRPGIELSDPLVRIGLWGSFIVIGMIVLGFLGGTFGDRGICLWYGIGTGMLYWSRGQINSSR